MNKLRFIEEKEPWVEEKLGEVAEWVNGYAFKPNDLLDKGVPVIKIKELLDSSKLLVRTAPNSSIPANQIINKGDLIFSWSMTLATRIWNKEQGYLNQHLYKVIPVQKLVNKEYLHQLIVREIPSLKNKMHGGTAKHITRPELLKHRVHLPSLPEQEKIGGFLSALDEEIECQSELVDLLALEYKGYSQRIFSQQLRFKDENGVDYPEWEEKKLGDIENAGKIKLGRGRVISKNDVKQNSGEYPIYSSSAMNNGLFATYGQYDFEDEMLTWSVDGGGKFFYRPAHKYSITNVCGWIKVIDENISTRYLYEALMRQWQGKKFDYSHKAHPSVIRDEYTIPLPSLPEQQKIGGFLSSLSERIESEKELLVQLKERKKAYLQKLFP